MHRHYCETHQFSNIRDRVVVAGDWHGDFPWAWRVVELTARRAKIDVILHVGDFGIDPGLREGQLF